MCCLRAGGGISSRISGPDPNEDMLIDSLVDCRCHPQRGGIRVQHTGLNQELMWQLLKHKEFPKTAELLLKALSAAVWHYKDSVFPYESERSKANSAKLTKPLSLSRGSATDCITWAE